MLSELAFAFLDDTPFSKTKTSWDKLPKWNAAICCSVWLCSICLWICSPKSSMPKLWEPTARWGNGRTGRHTSKLGGGWFWKISSYKRPWETGRVIELTPHSLIHNFNSQASTSKGFMNRLMVAKNMTKNKWLFQVDLYLHQKQHAVLMIKQIWKPFGERTIVESESMIRPGWNPLTPSRESPE